MASDPSSVFTIEGTALDDQSKARPNVRVVAIDRVTEQQSPDILVWAVSGADGRFSLGLSAETIVRLFRTGVDAAEGGSSLRPMVSRSRAIALVAYASGTVVGRLELAITLDGLASGYDLTLPTTESGQSPLVQQGLHEVTGVLLDEQRRPVAGYIIEVLHQRLSDESVIATGQSGSDGSFRLYYDTAALLGPDMVAIAIAARALEPQGTGPAIERVRSERYCPAPSRIEVELSLPASTSVGDEIGRIAGPIDSRRDEMPWSDLGDDEVELIACETGIGLDRVSRYVQAARVAESISLPVEAIYALGARGITMSVAAIGSLPASVIQRELDGAQAQGLVPTWTDSAATAAQVANVMATRAAADDPEAPLGRVLTVAGLPQQLREDFVVGYVGRTGTVDDFWQSFAASHTTDEVDRTRFALTTTAIAQGYEPVIASLEIERQNGSLGSARDLATLSETEWRDRIVGEELGVPADYPGGNLSEQEALYAKSLARAAEEAFPTSAIVKRVAKTGRWSLVSSYIDDHPALDFRTTNARQYLADNPATGLTTPQQQDLLQELSEAQRLFMVAPRFDRDKIATTLLDAGLHSAQQIAGISPSSFIETHAAALGGDAIAKVVYDNAHHVAATLSILALEYAAPFNPTSVPAIGDKTVDPGDAPPDLEHLLGPMDYCACEHCRSVLSPAAYLVDLLRFLEGRPPVADEGGVAMAPFSELVLKEARSPHRWRRIFMVLRPKRARCDAGHTFGRHEGRLASSSRGSGC